MEGSDDTTGHCMRDTRYGQVLEPWTGALLEDGDVGHILAASQERVGIMFDEQGCGPSMKASTTSNFWCLGNRLLVSDAVVTLAKGGGQYALEDASNDGIRYLGGRVHCLIRGGRGSSSFETGSAEYMELSMRMLRVHRRAG